MKWRPISKLTDQEFDEMYIRHRLMVWNSCNGPYHLTQPRAYYRDAWDLKAEGVWEKYLILPEAMIDAALKEAQERE